MRHTKNETLKKQEYMDPGTSPGRQGDGVSPVDFQGILPPATLKQPEGNYQVFSDLLENDRTKPPDGVDRGKCGEMNLADYWALTWGWGMSIIEVCMRIM